MQKPFNSKRFRFTKIVRKTHVDSSGVLIPSARLAEQMIRGLRQRLESDEELYQRFRQDPDGGLADFGFSAPLRRE